jgi:hypothetical protein
LVLIKMLPAPCSKPPAVLAAAADWLGNWSMTAFDCRSVEAPCRG